MALAFVHFLQALREELQRRRGSSVGTAGTVEDAERIKALEEELERWVNWAELHVDHKSICLFLFQTSFLLQIGKRSAFSQASAMTRAAATRALIKFLCLISLRV